MELLASGVSSMMHDLVECVWPLALEWERNGLGMEMTVQWSKSSHFEIAYDKTSHFEIAYEIHT